jgi:hypothetical protein
MKSALDTPPFAAGRTIPKRTTILFCVSTALFCLEMSFTAYYELLPQGGQAFTRLDFSGGDFRLELSLAKLLGAAVLLVPVIPARLREWAYAGFAINLVSSIIAHYSISDHPQAFIPSSLTSVLWVISYLSWRRLEGARESRSKNSGEKLAMANFAKEGMAWSVWAQLELALPWFYTWNPSAKNPLLHTSIRQLTGATTGAGKRMHTSAQSSK